MQDNVEIGGRKPLELRESRHQRTIYLAHVSSRRSRRTISRGALTRKNAMGFEAVKGMLPEGVETFKSKMNEEFVLTVEQDGVYGVKCAPHYGMGMVALIVAGEPGNVDEAKTAKHPGKAKKVFEELLAQAGQ